MIFTHTHVYTERERESTFWQVEAERREARGVYEAFGGDLSDRLRRFGTEASGVSFRTWRAMGIASE